MSLSAAALTCSTACLTDPSLATLLEDRELADETLCLEDGQRVHDAARREGYRVNEEGGDGPVSKAMHSNNTARCSATCNNRGCCWCCCLLCHRRHHRCRCCRAMHEEMRWTRIAGRRQQVQSRTAYMACSSVFVYPHIILVVIVDTLSPASSLPSLCMGLSLALLLLLLLNGGCTMLVHCCRCCCRCNRQMRCHRFRLARDRHRLSKEQCTRQSQHAVRRATLGV